MNIIQTAYAVAPSIEASFLATGGQEPYSYEVLTGGAGGTIDASTGWYKAPTVWDSDPRKAYDTIRATDNLGETIDAQVMVGSPLRLFCEIIAREMGLSLNRVFLYNQKLFQPQDEAIYVVVRYAAGKVFGNNNRAESDEGEEDLRAEQYVVAQARLDVEILSRDASALWRKEEVLLALSSDYAQRQQSLNTFYIGRIPQAGRIQDISLRDGAAIPYRFSFPIAVQYAYPKSGVIEFFDDIEEPTITVNP